MAANAVLVDSSYYIHLLRAGIDPFPVLAATAATRDLVICGIVRCEVGRALRPEKLRQRFQQFWDVMINVPTDKRLWGEVEQTLWTLDRQGIVLPVSDVLIACSARRVNAAVLTLDRHFYDIPGLQVLEKLE